MKTISLLVVYISMIGLAQSQSISPETRHTPSNTSSQESSPRIVLQPSTTQFRKLTASSSNHISSADSTLRHQNKKLVNQLHQNYRLPHTRASQHRIGSQLWRRDAHQRYSQFIQHNLSGDEAKQLAMALNIEQHLIAQQVSTQQHSAQQQRLETHSNYSLINPQFASLLSEKLIELTVSISAQ